MPAPSPTPAEQSTRLVTEAEVVTRILADMDVTIAIRMSDLGEEIFFDIGPDTPIGATCLMKLARSRFSDDHEFHEDVINEASSGGYLLSDRPGFDADLKVAPAPDLVNALADAGVDVFLQRDRYLPWARPFVAFRVRAEQDISGNIHLLMRLAQDRNKSDAEFAAQLADYLDARDTNA